MKLIDNVPHLTEQDEAILRRIYLDAKDELGELAGPHLWFYVVLEFLDLAGYKLQEKENDSNSRRQTVIQKYLAKRPVRRY